MQPAERQMRLRVHTRRGQHGHAALARRSLARGQQARLADARLAAKDEGATARGHVVEERRQEILFFKTTQKRHGFVIGRAEHDALIVACCTNAVCEGAQRRTSPEYAREPAAQLPMPSERVPPPST